MMKKIILLITVLLFTIISIDAQEAKVIHLGINTRIIMKDSVTMSDSVNVTIMLKLTDKSTTKQVIVELGLDKDNGDIDNFILTIINTDNLYYANNSELGNVLINGRTLIFTKKYHKDRADQIKWATAYLKRNDDSLSEKQYFRNFLPQ